MSKHWMIPALLLSAAAGLHAQQAAQPAAARQQLTPQQQAQFEGQNKQMAEAGIAVAQMIDKGQIGEVWDGASPVAKQTTSRKDFVQQVGSDRSQLGTPGQRKLLDIGRSLSQGGQLPAGYYVNVSYATQFSKAKQPVRELISFHLDADKTWRLAGYTVR